MGRDSALIEQTARAMIESTGFQERWVAINDILGDLGASAVNSALICRIERRPLRYCSSLPGETLADDVAGGFLADDFIILHAATSDSAFHWKTRETAAPERAARDAGRASGAPAFGNFVRDSGVQTILCTTRPVLGGTAARAITYLSEERDEEVLQGGQRQRIDLAIRIMLPFLESPEDAASSMFLPLGSEPLSPREAEVLRLLAAGLMNARIAETLGVTKATVAKHLISARKKLGAQTREQALTRALKSDALRL